MSEAALANGQSANMGLYLSMSPSSGGNPGSMSLQLFQQYGGANVQQSVNNAAASTVSEAVNKLIDSLPMPDFMRDAAKQQVAQALQSFQSSTPEGLDAGVNNVLSNPTPATGASSGAESGSGMGELGGIMQQAMQDEMERASSGSSKAGGGGGGNWLAILARALGTTAGEHLKKMVELGEKMGGLDSKENPEAFAAVQSEFQAESQIFKMFQEAIGTMVKSIGEGMSTVARKQ